MSPRGREGVLSLIARRRLGVKHVIGDLNSRQMANTEIGRLIKAGGGIYRKDSSFVVLLDKVCRASC